MEKLSGSVLCIFVLLHLYVLNMLCIVCLVSAFIAIFFHPFNCNIVSRVQSLQATMMKPAYWKLVYYIYVKLSGPSHVHACLRMPGPLV